DADQDLPDPFIVALARATARVLRPERMLIGRDTRASGPRLVAALAAGLDAEGVAPIPLGVLPTPAIAFMAARDGDPAAIVSASHNRWSDNGVKVIGADGRKLPDGAEDAIERELEALVAETAGRYRATGTAPGEPSAPAFGADAAAADVYLEHLLSTL